MQCVSTTTCERALSVHKLINLLKVRTMLGSKNLEAMLLIALEGPEEGVDDIISDVVSLWKNDSKNWFFMLIPLLI